jgi:cytochrome P450
MAFNDGSLTHAGVSGALPTALRPFLGPLSAWPVKQALERLKKHFGPFYHERVKLFNELSDKPGAEEPNDLLQMMIKFAKAERPQDLELDCMVKRLSMTNFGSMHQSTLAATNLILDIIASDAECNTISTLRDECNTVLGPYPKAQEWTKGNISRMTKTDSVIRESMRVNSFGNRAIMRVVAADGVVTEDGIELPKGSMVSVLSYPIHYSEDLFEDAGKYEPFRYARLRDRSETKTGNLSFVTTGPQFLPFGHGRHACPGRFLVDFEFKMMIAHLVGNYDLSFPEEYAGKRPQNRWITEAVFPPKGAKIRVKRWAKKL